MYTLRKIVFLLLLSILSVSLCLSQTLPPLPLSAWQQSGADSPTFSQMDTLLADEIGFISDGSSLNDQAWQRFVAAAHSGPTLLQFGEGTYLFSNPLFMEDSLAISGQGAQKTEFKFDLSGQAQHLIYFQGHKSAQEISLADSLAKQAQCLYLASESSLTAGDWILLSSEDTALTTSRWGRKSTGQVLEVTSASNQRMCSRYPIRRAHALQDSPKVAQIFPLKHARLSCLKLTRLDSTTAQTSNVYFRYASNCEVTAIESQFTNFAHIEINFSSNITVRNSLMYEAHSYGGGGQAYGVSLQYASGQCLIENNVFHTLRHAILLQAGANGNVIAYNYSYDPFWVEPGFPSNSAGDLVLHGNYPYANLFEGNVVQNLVIDASHGINGPENTFLRNRVQLFGLIMAADPASDGQIFMGNEITDLTPLLGWYLPAGTGHIEFANVVKGIIQNALPDSLPPSSLYLDHIPSYYQQTPIPWPVIGVPNHGLASNIEAEILYQTDQLLKCRSSKISTQLSQTLPHKLFVYPNPSTGKVFIEGLVQPLHQVQLFDMQGKRHHLSFHQGHWDLGEVPAGIYYVQIRQGGKLVSQHKVLIIRP